MSTDTSQRAQLFSLLGRILISEIDMNMLVLLQNPDVVDTFEKIQPGYSNYINQKCNENTLENLAVDYCQLFILPDKKSLSLKASHWSPDVTTSEQIENLVAQYRNNTNSTDGFTHLPNDHLGLLLNFISHLLVNNDVKVQKQADHFIQITLQPWIHDFTQKLNERTNNPLYCASAKLLSEII